MTVRMLVTERIAIDGRDVRWYREGEILHLPESLAIALTRDGVATTDLSPKESPRLASAEQPKGTVFPTRKREYKR